MTEQQPTPAEAAAAHRALMDDLRSLDQACSAAPPQRPTADVTAQLVRVRHRLRDHFRFEEQNGYADVVQKEKPFLERSVRELLAEHGRLMKALDVLIAQAPKSRDGSLRKRVREWVRRVRRHEGRENRLLEDAFDIDICGED